VPAAERAATAAVLIAALLAAAPAPVRAQTATPPPEPEETAAAAGDAAAAERSGDRALPRVEDTVVVEDALPYVPTSSTIAAKLPLPLRLTPASVSVVGAPMLDEQHATVLGDALLNVSGVNVQTGNGVFDFFVVRGFDSVSSSLILTDGAPEPESSFYHLYNVERAEVLKGPGAFLYGGSPLAATVNLVRKQPLPARFVRLAAGAGSFGTAETTADANLGSADGRHGLRVNALWRSSDGYRDRTDFDDAAVNPTYTWRPDDRTALNVSYERIDNQYSTDVGLPLVFSFEGEPSVAEVPRTRSYQSPFDTSEQTVDRFQADYEIRIGERLAVRDKLYWRRFDWLSRGTTLNGVFPGATGELEVARTLLLLDDAQRFVGNQLEATIELGGGGVTHHLLAGLEVALLEDDFTFDVALLPGIGLDHPAETAPGSIDQLFRLPGQGRAADAESRVAAPYLIDQIGIGERFGLLLGARFDRIDFEDRESGIDRTDQEVSPLVGLVWAPRDDLSVYANAGSAFAPPSTFALAPDQVPEESRQAELGVKQSFLDGRVAATAALYRLDRDNVAIPDATGIQRQTGDQRSQGLELEVAAVPRPGLRVFVAYAYTDSELTTFRELVANPFTGGFVVLDHSGNRPAFVPEQVADLWVSQRLAAGFGVAGGARWVGEQFIDEDNQFAIDGYLTLRGAVTWARGPWRLSLNLDNLTDEDYLTRGFGGTSVIPAAGFETFGRVEYTF
jgi:catecholate siderophore receptor